MGEEITFSDNWLSFIILASASPPPPPHHPPTPPSPPPPPPPPPPPGGEVFIILGIIEFRNEFLISLRGYISDTVPQKRRMRLLIILIGSKDGQRILAAVILGGALSVSRVSSGRRFFGTPSAGPVVLGISSGAKL